MTGRFKKEVDLYLRTDVWWIFKFNISENVRSAWTQSRNMKLLKLICETSEC